MTFTSFLNGALKKRGVCSRQLQVMASSMFPFPHFSNEDNDCSTFPLYLQTIGLIWIELSEGPKLISTSKWVPVNLESLRRWLHLCSLLIPQFCLLVLRLLPTTRGHRLCGRDTGRPTSSSGRAHGYYIWNTGRPPWSPVHDGRLDGILTRL